MSVVAVAAPAAASGAQASVQARVAKCPKLPAGVKEGKDVRCYAVRQPLRHGRRPDDQRKVTIGVTRAVALRHTSAPPLIFLSGGPGEPNAQNVLAAVKPKQPNALSSLRRTRDIYFIEQRGVGLSRPELSCEKEMKAATSIPGTDAEISALVIATYEACAGRLKRQGIDLGGFTTAQIAQDLDSVRRALHIGRADVQATSYGTKVALAAAQRNPKWIRRMLLVSTIDPRANFALDAPGNLVRAVNTLNATCNLTSCRTRYGNLREKLDAGIESLAQAPLTSPAAPGQVLTAGLAITKVFSAFYTKQGIDQLPSLISAIARRDPKLLKAGDAGATAGLVTGQEYSVLCGEELSHLTAARIARASASLPSYARTFAGTQTTLGLPAVSICKAFDRKPQVARPTGLSNVRMPVLLVSGSLDQVTPPSYAAAVRKRLPRATSITLPAGHSAVNNVGPCGQKLVVAFFDVKRLPQCPKQRRN
ncbi:alpha/beta hydrolase [Paraconexibacter sp. AEG42_29]|uniref:alpha/beta hydrolase n=1 Tax=Paraconexibacter sp. AEG42_29 TaxID=2997339 RepID=UPI00339D615F